MIVGSMKNMLPTGSGDEMTVGPAFKLQQHVVLELDVKVNAKVEGKPVSVLATARMAEVEGLYALCCGR